MYGMPLWASSKPQGAGFLHRVVWPMLVVSGQWLVVSPPSFRPLGRGDWPPTTDH